MMPAEESRPPAEAHGKPRAWIGPRGQLMPAEAFAAWAPRYPDDAQHYAPLYDRAAMDAAVAAAVAAIRGG